MKYWVYMPLWNDEDLVRIVLKHYETADRIIFYDVGSTDSGPDIVRAAGREVRSFDKTDRLCDKTNINMKNTAWKEAKGQADYVIVQDTDELIFFADYPNDIIGALNQWKEKKVTHSSVVSIAVIMKDNELNATLQRLSANQHPSLSFRRGVREDPILQYENIWPYLYDKPMIFSPDALDETNFAAGQHEWAPHFTRNPVSPEVIPAMLHCRYLGQTREFNRTKATRERIKHQFSQGLGFQYDKTDQMIQDRIAWIYSQGDSMDLFGGFRRVVQFKGAQDFVCRVFDDRDYISQQISKGLTWEPTVAAAIAKLCGPDTLFVDIGANLGLHSLTAALCGATVLAYEAHPTTCEYFKRSIIANGWTKNIILRELACSDSDGGTVKLTDDPNNMGGSSIEVRAKGTEHLVLTRKLDTENIHNLDARNIVIKLDIEGHEEQALRGMTKTLKDTRVTAVIVELNSIIKSAQYLIEKIYEPLESLGFTDVRILLNHPNDPWQGQPIEPKIPKPLADAKNIIRKSLSNPSVVEAIFLRDPSI